MNSEQAHSSFTRLASFSCDLDEDEHFSEQDLQIIDAIEAQFLSSKSTFSPLAKKPRFISGHCHDDHGIPTASAESPRWSVRRLPKSLLALQHPKGFSLSPCLSGIILPEMKFSGQINYSRTVNDVDKAAKDILKIVDAKKGEREQIALGFDIEWKPTFRRGVPPGKVAVMQICSATSHCHVLHIIHSGIPQSLQLLLEDPTVFKVGVGIANDALKVFKDYNVSIKGVEDLSSHANQKLGGDPKKWSLASLTEILVSKQLAKPNKVRLGNWETKVLSKEQLQYAATDAFTSWYLYQVIRTLPEPQEAVPDQRGDVEDGPN